MQAKITIGDFCWIKDFESSISSDDVYDFIVDMYYRLDVIDRPYTVIIEWERYRGDRFPSIETVDVSDIRRRYIANEMLSKYPLWYAEWILWGVKPQCLK